MKKQTFITKLHKPVHPVLSIAAVGGVIAIGALLILLLQNARTSVSPSNQYQAQVVPTATPTPVDTPTWKTWTDWKGGYSVKLPKTFSPVGLNKAFTDGDPDPSGTGAMHFGENVKSSKDAVYGFSVEFTPDTTYHTGKQCASDEECYMNNFKFHSNGKTVHATILGRDIKGIKVTFPPVVGGPPNYFVNYYFDFIVHDKPFSVYFHYGDINPNSTQKEPVFRAILSSLSF